MASSGGSIETQTRAGLVGPVTRHTVAREKGLNVSRIIDRRIVKQNGGDG
jgi:hypothetical protein